MNDIHTIEEESKYLEEEEDPVELTSDIIKFFFEYFKTVEFLNIDILVQEEVLLILIKEMDPLFQYDNNILNILDKYFSIQCEKYKYVQLINISEILKINELLNKNPSQLLILGEILIVLSSITPNKEIFIDKLGTMSEKYQFFYISTIEKYVENFCNTSIISQNISTKQLNEYKKVISELNKKLQENEKNYKEELDKYNNIIVSLKEEIVEKDEIIKQLDEKVKPEFKDLNISRSDSILADAMLTQFQIQISGKEEEIKAIYEMYDSNIKEKNEEILKLNKQLHETREQFKQFVDLDNEFKKLKAKNKELLIIKEKCADYEDLKLKCVEYSRTIDKMKTYYENEIQNLLKLNKESPRVSVELERLILEKKLSFQIPRETIKSEGSLSRESIVEMEGIKEMYITEIESLRQKLKNTNTIKKELEEQTLEIKNKYNSLKEENDKAILDLKKEISHLKAEREKLVFEKHNLEMEREKSGIELSNITHNFNKDKKDLELKLEKLKVELEGSIISNTNLKNENNSLSSKYNTLNQQYDELLQDKAKLTDQTKSYKDELSQIREEVNKLIISNTSKKSTRMSTSNAARINSILKYSSPINVKSSTPIASPVVEEDETYTEKLLNEIRGLKINIVQQEERINNLSEKTTNLENENIELKEQIKENLEKYKIEINDRADDLEFLRLSYDDQKNRVNREHEIISSNLYELALQFMTLRTELYKHKSFVDNK